MAINQVTTNPDQLNDRVTAVQAAQALDELNNLAVTEYTAAGAIAIGGTAYLKAGGTSAIAMTIPAPLAGSQLNGGNDGAVLEIIALDAALYTVTGPADCINGAYDTITFGSSTSLAGLGIKLKAFGGVWYTSGQATLAGAASNGTVKLQEV
jgi:hypothetical protein